MASSSTIALISGPALYDNEVERQGFAKRGPTTLGIAWEDLEQALVDMHPRILLKREVSGFSCRATQFSGTILRQVKFLKPYVETPKTPQNIFQTHSNGFQPNGSIPNRSFNNHPQSFNNQSSLEGLVSNFMASQDARLSKFKPISNDNKFYLLVLPKIDLNAHLTLPTQSILSRHISRRQPFPKQACGHPRLKPNHHIPKEPELTLKDEFQDLHLNLSVLEV
ncbi:hypothetical protein Tco_0270128 [Tanacetum coccineum]